MGWLTIAVSTLPYCLTRYGFSHTLAVYCRQISDAVSITVWWPNHAHTSTLCSTRTASCIGVSNLQVQQLDLNVYVYWCVCQHLTWCLVYINSDFVASYETIVVWSSVYINIEILCSMIVCRLLDAKTDWCHCARFPWGVLCRRCHLRRLWVCIAISMGLRDNTT